MRALSALDVARAAGVRLEDVARFVEVGVLRPDPMGAFRPSDVARVRLVAGLTTDGLTLDEVADAVISGKLGFDFVDQLMPEPVRLVSAPTGEEAAALERMEEVLRPVLGTDREPLQPMREDDLEILRIATQANDLGLSDDQTLEIIRSIALTASRLVTLQRDFIDEVLIQPAIEETGSPIAALEMTSGVRLEYRELGRLLTVLLMDRFVDDAIFKNLVQLAELALDECGVDETGGSQAIVFIDVSEYTRRSEEQGDAAAAEQALRLVDFVRDLSGPFDGRLVKSLGDGAMVHAPGARAGVLLALEAVQRASDHGLWELHAGVNTGRMVRRDGDFYGSAVNVAARVAGEASPGEVVVTGAVVDEWTGTGVDFAPLGDVNLKNVSGHVTLYRATQQSR